MIWSNNSNGLPLVIIHMKEIWCPITKYENSHEVSNLGRIRRIKDGYIYATYKNDIGYMVIGLRKNGSKKHYKVHRLVAKAFCKNDLNKPYINHRDGNKENNCFKNLEWVTASENTQHAYRMGLMFKDWVRDSNGKFKTNNQDNSELVLLDS